MLKIYGPVAENIRSFRVKYTVHKNYEWIINDQKLSLKIINGQRYIFGGSGPLGEQFGKFLVGELNFWLGEPDELANVISNLANAYINFAKFIWIWRTPKLFHF